MSYNDTVQEQSKQAIFVWPNPWVSYNRKEHGLGGFVGQDSSTGGVCVGRAFPTLHQSTFAAGNKIIHRLLLRRSGAIITG